MDRLGYGRGKKKPGAHVAGRRRNGEGRPAEGGGPQIAQAERGPAKCRARSCSTLAQAER